MSILSLTMTYSPCLQPSLLWIKEPLLVFGKLIARFFRILSSFSSVDSIVLANMSFVSGLPAWNLPTCCCGGSVTHISTHIRPDFGLHYVHPSLTMTSSPYLHPSLLWSKELFRGCLPFLFSLGLERHQLQGSSGSSALAPEVIA